MNNQGAFVIQLFNFSSAEGAVVNSNIVHDAIGDNITGIVRTKLAKPESFAVPITDIPVTFKSEELWPFNTVYIPEASVALENELINTEPPVSKETVNVPINVIGLEKFKFTNKGKYNFETPLNEAIERVLRKKTALD